MNLSTNHSGSVNGVLPTPCAALAEQYRQQSVDYPPAVSVGLTTEIPTEPVLLSQRRVCHTSGAVTSANSRLTTAHVGQIGNIIDELRNRELYLLALQLDLPRSIRLTLLYTAAVHKNGHDYLIQQLRQIPPDNLFTHQQLLGALTRSGRLDLAEMYCCQFNIPFAHRCYDNTLQCEEAGRDDSNIDQVLSHFDLCQIFTGQLVELSAIPLATLAQTTGHPGLLSDPVLAELQSEDTLAIYRFLENIVAAKGRSLTVREAVTILCKPEIGQINIAHRLLNAVTGRQPSVGQTDTQKIELGYQPITQTWRLIQGLVDYKVPLDVNIFAHTLGVPVVKMTQIPAVKLNTPTLMNIIGQSRKLRDQLSPGHILYALQQAAIPYDVDWLYRAIQHLNVPLFHHVVACPPPLISAPLAVAEILTRAPDSVPLTMNFLGDLPLSHNWVLIGLAMGLSTDELKGISEVAKPDTRLTAFYLSTKLTEPGRQLETGDLYQALLQLDDQEALRHFPKRLSFKRSTELPTAIRQAMTSGLKTAKALCKGRDIKHLSNLDPLLYHEWVNNRV